VNATGTRIARAYVDACHAELRALKPGNVHVHAEGHGMTVELFERSAEASAPAMSAPGLSIGERILRAVERTHAVAGCNTNLGIVLLCAPLAAAAFELDAHPSLRDALRAVLARLTLDDAEQAYAAIRLAAPGGLGTAPAHDVAACPTVTLLEAMRAARERDRIAAQYASDYRDVFELGVPRLESGRARWPAAEWATTLAFLGFLSAFPDTHIERQHGAAAAVQVQREARALGTALERCDDPATLRAALMALDATLKRTEHNPGTSADLTVASLFAHGLMALQR
jgi:triphosphoribosyl-dephospho-CoA synthase